MAEQVGHGYREAGLTPKQVAMLEFAEFLTVSPSSVTRENVQELRNAGWTDEDVIDIVHITAYFNYMVRVADGLGIELQEDQGWEPNAEKLEFKGETAAKAYGNIAAVPTASMPAR